MRRYLLFVILLIACLGRTLCAAEVIPRPPTAYFNDYASAVQQTTADTLNRKLAQFERDTSNQIVVVVYPKMQSDSSIEEYTVRVAQAWGFGQAGKKNGAVLFVFKAGDQVYLQVGYGLEGAIPDALAKRIIDNEITPAFHAGDYDAGLTAGVTAIMAAAKGEYQGTGQTVQDRQRGHSNGWVTGIVILFVVVFLVFSSIRRGTAYNSYGSSGIGWQIAGLLLNILSNSSRSSGGGWSSSGGGGDGLSAGGGSFGGGGAGGSW